MPASMLDSQLATLEPLEPEEPGTTLDATATPHEIAERIIDDVAPLSRGFLPPSRQAPIGHGVPSTWTAVRA